MAMPSVTPALARQAEEQVLRDLIDALLQENLLDLRRRLRVDPGPNPAEAIPGLDLAEGELWLSLPLGSGRELRFRGRRCPFLQPYRLSRPPVALTARTAGGLDWQALGPVAVMRTLAEHLPGAADLPNLAGFLQDLEDAVAQTALSMAAAPPGTEPVGPASLVGWERLAALRDRPFHPSARAKGGWGADEYRRFSPEFGAAFGLDWLAVRWDALTSSPAAAGAGVAPLLLAGEDQRRLEAAFAAAGLSPAEYLVLPVHPWQMEHVLPQLYAGELAARICVPVARNLGRFVATSSVRSLAPAGGGPLHVKLPLGIYSLGALRILPPRYLHNGERAQQVLAALVAREPRLAPRLHLCGEDRWWAFAAPGGDPFADKPGHLACLLRTYPERLLTDPAVALIPMSALAAVTPDGRLPAVAWILSQRHGEGAGAGEALALFRAVCRRLTEVALLCFRYGVMPELHGQNVVLVLRGGRVEGLLLRDHDTLRVHLPWLEQAGLPRPGYIVRPDTPNTLINPTPEALLAYFQTLGVQVNLYAIATALAQVYGMDESRFWQAVREAVAGCLDSLDLPSPVQRVLAQHLLRSGTWPVKLVLTPLLQRQGTGGGGMPSGMAEIDNPLARLPAGAPPGATGALRGAAPP